MMLKKFRGAIDKLVTIIEKSVDNDGVIADTLSKMGSNIINEKTREEVINKLESVFDDVLSDKIEKVVKEAESGKNAIDTANIISAALEEQTKEVKANTEETATVQAAAKTKES